MYVMMYARKFSLDQKKLILIQILALPTPIDFGQDFARLIQK